MQLNSLRHACPDWALHCLGGEALLCPWVGRQAAHQTEQLARPERGALPPPTGHRACASQRPPRHGGLTQRPDPCGARLQMKRDRSRSCRAVAPPAPGGGSQQPGARGTCQPGHRCAWGCVLLVNVIHIQGHSSVTRSAVRSSDITRSVSTRASRDAMIFSQNQYWLVERIFVFV